MNFIRKKHQGIGLLELMLSLAIIGAILLMATRYYKQASEAEKVTQATQTISTLVNASFEWLKGQPNFQELNIDKLATAELLPNNWETKKNPWGGNLILKGYAGGGAYQQIQITMENIPTAACIDINDIMEKQGMKLGEGECGETYIGIYPSEDE